MEKMSGLVPAHQAVEACLTSNEQAWEALGNLLPGHDLADGAASDHDKIFRSEAAWKLIVNHDAVIRDCCNHSDTLNIVGNPLTQTHLARIQPDQCQYADQALREVARRLLGPHQMSQHLAVPLSSLEQAKAWTQTCTYELARIQIHPDEKPGRTQDMAPQAALDFRAVLAEVANLSSQF